ncbi:MAG: tRNA-dihydrouridine synthase family protein [Lentisphaeria bacterium]|nr:tRNA-dihydrouridine synthase family protein [Lentisphaeria bacterium]
MNSPNTEHYQRSAPYYIDTLPFQPATLFAPMEGFSNFALRTSISDNGAIGLLCTEFIRISQHAVSPKLMKRHVIKTPGIPLSVQVMGNAAEYMADSAERLIAAGADIIDVNLGCPTSRAAKGNVGAAMLKDPQLLFDVLSEMRQSIHPPTLFSAKIRAGFNESDHILTIANAVEASGVDFIIVHPRRAKDAYKGKADWRIIKVVKDAVKIPVVGNGDVTYPEDAIDIKEQTNCDAIMIGRGALRNPWIFRQIAELENGQEIYRPDGEELLSWLKKYSRNLSDYFKTPEERLLPRLKDISKFTLKLLKAESDLRTDCLRSQSIEDYWQIISKGLAHLKADDFQYLRP